MIKTESPIAAIRDLVQGDFNRVNQLIMTSLYSDVELICEISHYIINSGGKRLRPLLVLLSARALNCQQEQHISLATIIEFIHTATLLHDDVVDGSEQRRNRKTANAVYGNAASVLVGDFLYSRAFQMMAEINNSEIIHVLANTTNTIAEGEVLQLLYRNNAAATEADYFNVIRCKTAKLFEAATQLGAIIAEATASQQTAMVKYGLHLGLAYQLIDDVLDYTSDTETLGKNLGDDLAEGKPTLPLIYTLQNGTEAERKLIQKAIEKSSLEDLPQILDAIRNSGALDYAKSLAQGEIDIAISALNVVPKSDYRDALINLAHFAVEREY
jgi:octaprenyl-diphosphate synthase